MKYKDKDHFEIALRLRTLPYAVVCAGLGFMAAAMMGAPLFKAILIALGAGVLGFLLPLILAEKAGAAGASIYHSSGTSTPPVREYSLADSLAARGKLEEAAEAYQLLSEDYPLDPEPRVRLARLLRDRMQRGEDAAMWLRSAIMIQDIDSAVEISLVRELCELYTHRLRTPEKALPWLSRLAAKYPQHSGGVWARTEMTEIRQAMKERND
jgi:hypothetical protein